MKKVYPYSLVADYFIAYAHADPWVYTRLGLTQDQHSERIISKESIRKYFSRYVEEVEDEQEKTIDHELYT